MTDCILRAPRQGEYYTRDALIREATRLLGGVAQAQSLGVARRKMLQNIGHLYNDHLATGEPAASHEHIRSRDCLRALSSMLTERADRRAGFSLAQALWDIARGQDRDDLEEGFYAEMIHLIRGLESRSTFQFLLDARTFDAAQGRQAALARSDELDDLWAQADLRMARIPDGMSDPSIRRRRQRRQEVLAALGGRASDWQDWRWQVANILDNAQALAHAVTLTQRELLDAQAAQAAGVPFALTPYYASLMDHSGTDDRAIRAQVLPPPAYVQTMADRQGHLRETCDFMREQDTSPVDLVTRRYPAIAILKPFNTCPQLCVYCQRNWELKSAMAPGSMASDDQIDAAVQWIGEHPAIREVLITGGDPLAMDDEPLRKILEKVASLDSVDMIRIGTRVPVTLPMRITDDLAGFLGSLRRLGKRDVAVMTHVEHPYEITPDLAVAVDRLKRAGLSVYNQQVYTFYVSRRFETALLRLMLRRVGIDPYYTFAPKAKPETRDYRVPLARILQERKEEGRLLPGLRRTDEPVFNVPGLGKNHLRAAQHHDLLSVLGNGARMYEFHPWEKNVVQRKSYVLADMPILDYLARMEQIGEDPADYESIWYYF